MRFFRWLWGESSAEHASIRRTIQDPVPPPSGDPIVEYKLFIDKLVGPGFVAEWVREGRFDDADETTKLWLDDLSAEQRQILARIVQQAEDWGTWRVLNVIDVYSFRLSRDVVELPVLFPHGLSTLCGSWYCRKKDDPWPEQPGETFRSFEDDD